MIRISGPKIQDVAKEIDGKTIEGVTYKFTGKIEGIRAYFETDSNNEEDIVYNETLKKYLKKAFPILRLYVEKV